MHHGRSDRDLLPPLLHHRPADPTVGTAGGQHLRQLSLSFSPKAIPLLVIAVALFIVGMIYGDRLEQLILNYIAKRKNS